MAHQPLKISAQLALAILASLIPAGGFAESERSFQKIKDDCEKLVRQDVYRKISLSGIYWPGFDQHTFWAFHSVSEFLLFSGLSFLEVDRKSYIGQEHSLTPEAQLYREPGRSYYRVYLAEQSSKYCAPFEYLTKKSPHRLASLIHQGLGLGQCIAIEPVANPVARYEIQTSRTVYNGHIAYLRQKFIDRNDGDTIAENLSIRTMQPSDKFGGYVCMNNARALNGFPWNAIEVIPTANAPTRREIVSSLTPPVFEKTRTVTPISETVLTEPGKTITDLEVYQNTIVDEGRFAIVNHRALQIVDGNSLKIVRLDNSASQLFTFSVLRKHDNKLFVLGYYTPDQVAILQFSLSGEPIQMDFVLMPPQVSDRRQGRYFNLSFRPNGYDVHTHLMRLNDSTQKVLSTHISTVDFD